MNRKFESYVNQLENLAQEASTNYNANFHSKSISTALDGGPRAALNTTIPISRRRKEGVFFTSSALAKKALSEITNQINRSTVFLDPACGAGDLLISCANVMPIGNDLESTLHEWGSRLIGFDLRPEFIRAAKARLLLTALSRFEPNKPKSISNLDQLFPLLSVGNCFNQINLLKSASVIMVNPPYQSVTAPKDCEWATGKVSAAALFIEHCVSNSLDNSKVVAILPDVLRSGSRYATWRNHIAKYASIEKVVVIGRFDQWTDVDVFILHLRVDKKKKDPSQLWQKRSPKSQRQVLGDLFDVHVGAVVPHRDEETGCSYPYLVARDLPIWKKIVKIAKKRRFSGTVYSPPFVVVRRTSRPGDITRATGTIISGKNPVAVENHLMVLQPKDGKLASCRKLLINLRRQETSDWLDNRIRCRHLTVTSLAELPWWND